jgi:cytochrome c oxidase subunit 3
VLLFGGLFCGYAVWRGNHPELFKYGSQFLDTTLGAINTAVLILSSMTMAWAVTLAQQNKQRGMIICLVLTLGGAAGFLVIKYFEYTHKFHEGYFPGLKFYDRPAHSHTFDADEPLAWQSGTIAPISTEGAPSLAELGLPPGAATDAPTIAPAATGPGGLAAGAMEDILHSHDAHTVHPLQDVNRPPNPHLFFNIYFMMTGLHGVHVLVGGIVIIWLIIRGLKGHFSSEYFTPVDLGGLYWHVVDLIWIFLFPLFYLI